MKRISLYLFLLFFSFTAVYAQKRLTLEQAVFAYSKGLYPKTLPGLQWRSTLDKLVYVKDYSTLVQIDPVTDQEQQLVTLDEINEQLPDGRKLQYLYDIRWLSPNTFYLIQNHTVIVFNVENKKIIKVYKLPQNARNIFYSPEAKAVAFTIKNNLFYMDSLMVQRQITFDKDTNIVNGDNYVHRQEFGIDHGIFWSPNGNYIAFYRKDQRMVENYPVIDYTVFPAKVHYFKYPFAGHTSEQVKLGVYNLKTHEIVYLNTGQPADHYLTQVTWDPSENYIYIGILNRDQNHLWLNKYDIHTGDKVKTLFEETNPKYVEPLFPLYFVPHHPDKFLYFSQRDGWQHLYLYDTSGTLIRQVTKGKWEVTKLLQFSHDGQYVYVQTTKISPIQRHVYKVNLNNGRMLRLTSEHGEHTIAVSADDQYYFDSYSSLDVPRKIDLYKNSRFIRNLLTASDPLADYDKPTIKIGTITAADGKTKLYYRLILPPHLDKSKKYPAIVYVYGGPHVQLIHDTYLAAAQMWLIYLAQKGYVVFTVDNRGSDNRGFAFESVIYRQLGVNEMKDQIQGVKFLKSLPFVDSTRLGVTGWSFGGFMTTSLVTTYPDVFKVAVAGGPVIDWSMYEVMYGERYMDTPQANPEGYAKTSVLNKIQNLKAKLLIIHGQIDPVVVPQNSLRLLMKAQKLNIQIDYYPYPHQEHGVRGIDRLHLRKKITDYFDENL